MRTLAVFASIVPDPARPKVQIPYSPFIRLLSSPVWKDRNKSSLALMQLSESRDAMLLSELRKQALGPLVEMVRWKSAEHARAAFEILGRIAGRAEEAIEADWARGERQRLSPPIR